MKRIALYFLLFTASSFCVHGQSNDPLAVPSIIPRSPEAENLGRYGEIAVGEYTDTPDISIPLHVIRSGNLEFPLNLTYNAQGG